MSGTLEKIVSMYEADLDEYARMRDAIARVGEVLSENGCDCDCEHYPDEHDDDCERCLGCRVEAALRGAR
jgi:hypothetical protein